MRWRVVGGLARRRRRLRWWRRCGGAVGRLASAPKLHLPLFNRVAKRVVGKHSRRIERYAGHRARDTALAKPAQDASLLV